MTYQVPVTTRDATLSLLLKEGELSASKLALLIGISVQAMRRHLRNLKADGLVESISIALGPGRPSNVWHLTSAGQDHFNHGTGIQRFALDLLSSLESTLSSNSFNKVLTKQAYDQANYYRTQIGYGSISNRLEKFVNLRNKEGNKSDFHKSKNELSTWYLNAFDCSIRPIVEKFPGICDQELELIRTIFSDCKVQRVQWRLETGKACGFKLTSEL
tara:strand:+ start:3132 stop:3779 length:648 start_codon:yes stop_codon:yes gene_type:complete